MPRERVIWSPHQRRSYAPCRRVPHPAFVAVQNTQKRRRMELLGAQIANLRRLQGMPRQENLAEASGVGTRTISDVETGKVIPRIGTMRKIEDALHLPIGSTDDFLDGLIDRLTPLTSDLPMPRGDQLAGMTYDEILTAAKGIAKLYGQTAADRVIIAWSKVRDEELRKREGGSVDTRPE